MMSYLTMVDYPMSFLMLSTWIFFGGQVEGTIPRCSDLCVLLWDQTIMLKSKGVGGARVYVVAYSILVSAQGPLVLGLGLKGLG